MPGPVDPARLETLFDEVVDLPPEEAARVLDAACATRPDLRRAVERLLARDREAAGGPSLELDPALARSALRSDGALEPKVRAPLPESTRVGRYVVLRRLGAGAMGSVYVAYDESLDRRVALKVLRASGLSPRWLEREAQALARLAHPNVVHVYEIGEHEGRPFVAMELVPGTSLRVWLEEGGRAPLEILRVFAQAGRGLAAAHAAGVVHGDFKPDNVLVSGDGRARVVDFGVAVVDRAAGEEGLGGLVGTPAFMAPEQLLGETATEASDQFAFAVALYRALFGVAPFAGDDVDKLRAQVTAGALRSPPRTPAVPAWVTPVLLRGLARHPGARFASMAELLGALESRMPRDPELDPSVGRRERVRLAVAMIATTTAIAVAGRALGGLTRTLSSARALLAVAWVGTTAIALAIFLMRRRLLGNRFGRGVVALVAVCAATVIAHRAVALRFHQPVPDIIAVDTLAMGLEIVLAGALIDRRLVLASAPFLVGTAVVVASPGVAVQAFAASFIAASAAVAVIWSRVG